MQASYCWNVGGNCRPLNQCSASIYLSYVDISCLTDDARIERFCADWYWPVFALATGTQLQSATCPIDPSNAASAGRLATGIVRTIQLSIYLPCTWKRSRALSRRSRLFAVTCNSISSKCVQRYRQVNWDRRLPNGMDGSHRETTLASFAIEWNPFSIFCPRKNRLSSFERTPSFWTNVFTASWLATWTCLFEICFRM